MNHTNDFRRLEFQFLIVPTIPNHRLPLGLQEHPMTILPDTTRQGIFLVSGVGLDTAFGSLKPAEEGREFCTRECSGLDLLSHLTARISRLLISTTYHKTLLEVA
jgi:hypothetical protein